MVLSAPDTEGRTTASARGSENLPTSPFPPHPLSALHAPAASRTTSKHPPRLAVFKGLFLNNSPHVGRFSISRSYHPRSTPATPKAYALEPHSLTETPAGGAQYPVAQQNLRDAQGMPSTGQTASRPPNLRCLCNSRPISGRHATYCPRQLEASASFQAFSWDMKPSRGISRSVWCSRARKSDAVVLESQAH
jgi:hypothetical protein